MNKHLITKLFQMLSCPDSTEETEAGLESDHQPEETGFFGITLNLCKYRHYWGFGKGRIMRAIRVAPKTKQLSDGTTVTVRPIRPQDAPLLQAMHERLSPTSVQLRYLRPYTPSFEELEKLCHLSEDEGAAYVATVGVEKSPSEAVDETTEEMIEETDEMIVGIAYYIIEKEGEKMAEPAFLIEDRFQGQGIGHLLFRHLIQHAQAKGMHQFKAHVHPSNTAMMQIFRKGGYPLEATYAYGENEVQIQLDAAPTYRFSMN